MAKFTNPTVMFPGVLPEAVLLIASQFPTPAAAAVAVKFSAVLVLELMLMV